MQTIFDNPWLRYLAITFLSVSLLLVTGCRGCRSDNSADEIAKKKEEAENKKKKKKADIDTYDPVLLPGLFPRTKQEKKQDEEEKEDPLQSAMQSMNGRVTMQNRVKLGHWYTANFQAIANNFNIDGQLTAYSIDGLSRPVPIPATDYFVSTSRPVTLPKGEWKNFETTVFLPPRDQSVAAATVKYSLNRNLGGIAQVMLTQPNSLMKPFQYHMVVLTNRPERYQFLRLADPIQLRGQRGDGTRIEPFYYIVPSEPNHPLPLPSQALNWTTIAYLIWDDYDPNILEAEHQQAILDWLHYGGQLIVSGPDCLDKLQTSFLSDYLPAHFEGSSNLSNENLTQLNENWTVPSTRNELEERTFEISQQVPLLGVRFKPHVDAQFVDGTGEIAIERRVGRGRIVVTAFPLSAPSVRKWRSFKSFLNGALLRKPARNFGKSENADVSFEWVGNGTGLFDPMLHSTLRYLSRDLSRDGTHVGKEHSRIIGPDAGQFGTYPVPIRSAQQVEAGEGLRITDHLNPTSDRNPEDHWHYGGYQDVAQSGMAGWNDKSGISFAARETLKEAAGIKPPSSTFVLKMLAVYLAVLVPLNWLVFRLMGRVEYAWVAAPLIAIAGAVLVVKMASLDIGFVRSNSQIGLLEIHADYPRAHLAEYSALYTSLSTRYDADLDNLTAQSLPFAIKDEPRQFNAKETMSQVQLRRTVKNRLEGFQIQSNSTGMLHTEYMLELGGVFHFTPPTDQPARIENATIVEVQNAAVMGRDLQGNLQFAWVGELAPGTDAEFKFDSVGDQSLNQAWRVTPDFQNTTRRAGEIWSNNLGTLNPVSNDESNTQSGTVPTAVLQTIEGFPELSGQWPKYERLLHQISIDPAYAYSQYEFTSVYQVVNSSPNVTLGRMLDMVLDNLELAPGEYRLVGATAQRLGRTVFDPQSTQIDQQTLVVAHLKQPQLPDAKRDLNAYEDFKGRTSIDWDEEAIGDDELDAEFQDNPSGTNESEDDQTEGEESADNLEKDNASG